MKTILRKRRLPIILAIALLLLLTFPALAQSGGIYDLGWNTIDNGGGTFSTGGTFSLAGTIGQPDAATMAGEVYTLSGGFWAHSEILSSSYETFLPLMLR